MADEDEWYEVVALFQAGHVTHLEEGEHRTLIQGKVGDVTIARINVEGFGAKQTEMAVKATERMLSKAGIKEALIMPEGVDMLKLRKVGPERAAELTAQKQAKGAVKH